MAELLLDVGIAGCMSKNSLLLWLQSRLLLFHQWNRIVSWCRWNYL
jgi:hypothetical protein